MADTNDWNALPKPWSIEQCRSRYVTGDRINLRDLSKISGTPYSTIAHASCDDRWREQRESFRGAVSSKTIDIISSQIAGHQAEILKRHCRSGEEVFSVANSIVNLAKTQAKKIKERLEEISDDSDDAPKKSLFELQILAATLNTTQKAIESAIGVQRKALGLDYEDLNYAVASVRRSGYEVVGRSDFEAFKEYLENLSKNQDSEFSGNAVEVTTL